jgi:hypothetical protein
VPVRHFDAPPTTAHQPQPLQPVWHEGLQLPAGAPPEQPGTGDVDVVDMQAIGLSTAASTFP